MKIFVTSLTFHGGVKDIGGNQFQFILDMKNIIKWHENIQSVNQHESISMQNAVFLKY
jgi:hypothetical protein